jgi:hypothetical protein
MKNLTVIEAINDLIKATNIAYSRQAYTMLETREIINAIEFLGETIRTQQQAAELPASVENSSGPSDK